MHKVLLAVVLMLAASGCQETMAYRPPAGMAAADQRAAVYQCEKDRSQATALSLLAQDDLYRECLTLHGFVAQ